MVHFDTNLFSLASKPNQVEISNTCTMVAEAQRR